MYGDPRDLHVLTHTFPTRRSSELRLCPGDRAVEAWFGRNRWEMRLPQRPGQLGGLAIGMARIERGDIGIGQFWLAPELGAQPLVDRFARAVEHPQRQPQRPDRKSVV